MFAENLERLRSAKGLSQTDLANALGLCQSAISKWQTSNSLPRVNILIKLAEILDCTVEDLLK